ncbi:MAG: Brp/Blh family beta-carotene 15,15'-dioxygenase, partial [Halobaculum sp.]
MSVGATRPPTLGAALRRWGLRASWIAVLLLLPLAPVAAGLPPTVRYAPFLASVVLFGFPHGAVDHLVPGRLGDVSLVRSLAVVGAVYAVLGGLYTAWWFLAPVSAFVFFILLTWAHWGQGDLYALLAFAEVEHLPSRGERALSAVVRGGLPMLVPLVSHPGEYRRVATALVGLFGPAESVLTLVFTETARLAVGVGFGTVTVLALGLGLWRVRGGAARHGWAVDAGEVTLLWVYFLAVPPVLGIGLYFCLWHATRHLARLALIDDDGARPALAAGDLRTALWRLARDATPMTVGGLAVVGALFVLVPRAATGFEGLLALYLVGIAVLTLPHVAVVTWMDLRQEVW